MAAQQGKACSLAKLAASRLNPGDPVVPKALLGTDGHTGPGVSTVGHGPNSPPSTTRRWETLPFAPPGRPGSPTALGWQLQLARDSKGTSLGSAGGPCGPPWLWPGAGASRGQTCAKPFDGHGLTQSGGPGARPCLPRATSPRPGHSPPGAAAAISSPCAVGGLATHPPGARHSSFLSVLGTPRLGPQLLSRVPTCPHQPRPGGGRRFAAHGESGQASPRHSTLWTQ